jgi:predicted dithiol-disulfide oxidoreductase (DUF899 family)
MALISRSSQPRPSCALDNRVVYHTYSSYARGLDAFNAAGQLLDRAPKGRDEEALPTPIAWFRRHDEYEDDGRN